MAAMPGKLLGYLHRIKGVRGVVRGVAKRVQRGLPGRRNVTQKLLELTTRTARKAVNKPGSAKRQHTMANRLLALRNIGTEYRQTRQHVVKRLKQGVGVAGAATVGTVGARVVMKRKQDRQAAAAKTFKLGPGPRRGSRYYKDRVAMVNLKNKARRNWPESGLPTNTRLR
jgi:hypothetical protein